MIIHLIISKKKKNQTKYKHICWWVENIKLVATVGLRSSSMWEWRFLVLFTLHSNKGNGSESEYLTKTDWVEKLLPYMST